MVNASKVVSELITLRNCKTKKRIIILAILLPAFTGILGFSRFSRILSRLLLRNITGIREYYRFYR